MGIISGFLGGAGDAAAFIGKTYLVDQISREKDEANALRESNLRKDERVEDRKFKVSERVATEEAKIKDKGIVSADTKYTVDNKQKKESKPQLIKYTNKMGEQEGILRKNEDGTFTIVKPDTGEVMEERITREELKNKVAQMNTDEGRGRDWIPWNEYEKGDPEVRAAVIRDRKKAGMVGKQMKHEANKPTKKAGEFIGDSPHPEGKMLTKDGKIYVVTNGKPVLKK